MELKYMKSLWRYMLCVLFVWFIFHSIMVIESYYKTVALRWINNYAVSINANNFTIQKTYYETFGYGDQEYADIYVNIYQYRWQKFLQRPCFSHMVRPHLKRFYDEIYDWEIVDIDATFVWLKDNGKLIKIAHACQKPLM